MKNKKGLFLALGAGIAAGAAAFAYYSKNKKKKETDSYSYSDEDEEEMFFDFSRDARVNPDEAKNLALEAARKKLGKGANVASASDNKTLTVNIGGSRRHCYMFGAVADDLSVTPETLLFYVDAITGEVFDSND